MKNKLRLGPLEIIVFISGSVVMVLELIGSRIAAPYLGTSIFIWSSLIGIILGALSIGYLLGGRASAHNPRISFLSNVLLGGGLGILLIPLIKDPVLSTSALLGVKISSVVSTIALFVVPSTIMGMVSPYAIRLKTNTVEQSGGVAGSMYALSTVGSIFGTFLAGFYLIPTFSTSQILYGLSIVLILTSLIGKFRVLKIAALVLVGAAWFLSILIPSPYVYEADSEYNHIRVIDFVHPETKQELRTLMLSTEFHTIIDKNSDDIFSDYLKLYQLDTLFQPEIKKALVLGGGAYAGPVNLLKRHPNAEITVVEIDPAVTEVAKKYFQLKDNPRLTIEHADARIFLNTNKEKYDVIYGDAFGSYFSIPFQLTTIESVQLMYDALADDGVLIFNIISAFDGEKATFFKAQYKTLDQVFPTIYAFTTYYHAVEDAGKAQNIILVATKKPELTKATLLTLASTEQQLLINQLWETPIAIDEATRILTDEFAPVEFYVSKLL